MIITFVFLSHHELKIGLIFVTVTVGSLNAFADLINADDKISDVEIPLNFNLASASQISPIITAQRGNHRHVPRPLTVYTLTQQRADSQVDPCPWGLSANNIFPNLVGSKSCTVHANFHNDGLIMGTLSRAASRAQGLEQREAYE